jgi:uncharacterized LabA/DUF88 family protein
MRADNQNEIHRLAILIDADNASADIIESLFKEVAKYGTAHVRRIYGDWTSPRLGKWKDKLNQFAIQPIQQFGYTTGKNATDSALIIDAMDLLYTQNFDGFCIVSSDSDFTRLASRIRESGLVVYGFGERKTPEPFIKACDRFVYTEILGQPDGIPSLEVGESSSVSSKTTVSAVFQSSTVKDADRQKLKSNKKLITLFKDAFEAISEEDDWVNLGQFGSQLNKLSPSFDARNYNYKKLSDLVQASGLFEITKQSKSIQIKLKPEI